MGEPASNCAIDGVVVNATTGEAIPRAHVTVMGMNVQSGTSTDNQGRWIFSGLACGQTQVIATRPGFIQGSLGQPRVGAVFRPVILSRDSPLHDAKISLSPQAVVTGKVIDDEGDPMMNVTITTMAARVTDGRRTFQGQGSANTNDLGEYRIAGLPAGKYIVCAQSAGFNMNVVDAAGDSRVQEHCYPGPVEAGAASAMEIAGNTARVDFTLARVPAVKIRGTLSGSSGHGVAVSLYKRLPNMAGRIGMPATMAADGRFEIRGVTPGQYVLSADYWDSGKRLVARVPVEVGGADLDGVNVSLEPGFSLTGTVRIESKKATAADPRQINLILKSSDQMAGGGQMTWGKGRDSFTINELTPGNYRLECLPNGPFYLKSATLGGRDISKEEIPITQAAGSVEVVLSDETGALEGQVEDSEGKPIASWVMVLPASDQAVRQPRNIISGADGHFTVPNLAPGKYQVFAWDDPQQVEYANSDWMQRNSAPVSVTVEAGQTAQVSKIRQKTIPTL
ncbi:MAG: hypothetical protein QOJ99_2058 [Bryobacterales bacterium]|jgi:hypothetical protein|nr:hypothetical protein [Bryobacterales bacterium]